MEVQAKIKKHYKSGFSSSPIEIEQKEIDFIEKNNCECNCCGNSIFELCDFPKLLIDDDEIMCEDCYDEHHRDFCPICENTYDIKDFTSDFIVINEELSIETGKQPGIYQILKRPFFFGNILTGFDAFFDGALKLVVSIRINHFKGIDVGNGYCEVASNNICGECIERFVRKENYLKSDSIPCILMKEDKWNLFKDYTPEQLSKSRQNIIHKRITTRGLIQEGNQIKI